MMNRKVLFVDDERAILKAIKRRIGFDYTVETAESGSEALKKIENSGPYEIIFTDMRMPKMNGLEFILQARELTPDSLFVMLTGNNDKDTADNAFAQGRVFRFLNKPCDPDEIKATIEECVSELEHPAEVELRRITIDPNESLLDLLNDVVEARLTGVAGRSQRLEEKIECLRAAADLEESWELRAAAKALNLGLALLPESVLLGLIQSEPLSSEAQEIRAGTLHSTSQLVGEISGLENLAELFEQSGSGTGVLEMGSADGTELQTRAAATLLYVAMIWEEMAGQGVHAEEIAYAIKIHLPDLPEQITSCISESQTCSMTLESAQVLVTELQEGMIIGADVKSPAGETLVREGSRVTSAVIELLQWYPELEPIQLATCSVESDGPVLVS